MDGFVNTLTPKTSAEASLDIENVMAMGPGLQAINIYGVPYANSNVLDALHEMANPTLGEALPRQISTSFFFYYDDAIYQALQQFVGKRPAWAV
jgi:hypothetical protein